MFSNYSALFIFFFLSFLLSLVIFFISYLISSNSSDVEKLSSYECGFSPFEDTRGEFDIRFYLITILFVIFDLEISFLFPFAVSYSYFCSTMLFSMLTFLLVLVFGFYFE